MRVLIIDDNEKDVKGIRDYCEDMSWDCKITDFDQCYKEIMLFDPDVVVLDWAQNPGDDSGGNVLKSIWTNGYRPVVIFSGIIDAFSLDDEYRNSKLVEVHNKGDEEPVLSFLNKYIEYYGALSSFREDMGKSVIEAFKALEPIQNSSMEYPGEEVIKYILSKRAVSFFDFQESENLLPPWAMYIYPPVLKKNLSVCDIIRRVETNTISEGIGGHSEYRIVLTPSCDMVANETREVRTTEVLCAKCVEINKFAKEFGKISGESNKVRKNVDRMKSFLNAGYKDNLVPLPPLEGVLPNLIVDMKSLETNSLNKIAASLEEYRQNPANYDYIRVCSIDSPFREQIVWAYLHNACRPGVPDRDMYAWIDMIARESSTQEE